MTQPTTKHILAPGQAAVGRAVGAIHRDAFPIFIHEQVLEEILDYSEQDLGREIGGFLVGGWHEEDGPRVEVRHFLPATDARSKPTSLTFTHDTWSAMTRQVEQEFSGQRVVGWQHTHPDLGVFLSGYDLFIHRHFFSEPWQVAMVVDPCRGEFCFFQWRADRIDDCGFVCLPREQEGGNR